MSIRKSLMHRMVMFVCAAAVCAAGAEGPDAVPGHARLLLKEIVKNGNKYRDFLYDSFNRLTTVKSFDGDTATQSYSYDASGRLEKRLYWGFEETYRYSAEGALLLMDKYYPPTEKTWSEVYHRDSTGVIDKAATLFNGDTLGYILYKYDSRGNTVERSEYRSDGWLSSQERCAYDTLVNPLGVQFPFEMTRNGNVVSYYFFLDIMSSPPARYTSSFVYHPSGAPLREVRIEGFKNDTAVYEYRYDSGSVHNAQPNVVRKVADVTISNRGSGTALFLLLDRTAPVSASIFDISGKRIASLYGPELLHSGSHRIPLVWNDCRQPRHAGGVYILTVNAGGKIKAFKVPNRALEQARIR